LTIRRATSSGDRSIERVPTSVQIGIVLWTISSLTEKYENGL
jgi:hypothetical protein